MDMLGKIRRLRLRDGLSISEICRRTGLARNTVKRWLKAGIGAAPKYRRSEGVTVLQPYEERLRQWLEADARRSKRDRRTALALFGHLRQLGFAGSYSRVSEYVRRWRAEGATSAKSAFIPLKFALGEAFQFDWSEESLLIGGLHRKLLVAHTKLCASRAFLLVAYPTRCCSTRMREHSACSVAFPSVGSTTT